MIPFHVISKHVLLVSRIRLHWYGSANDATRGKADTWNISLGGNCVILDQQANSRFYFWMIGEQELGLDYMFVHQSISALSRKWKIKAALLVGIDSMSRGAFVHVNIFNTVVSDTRLAYHVYFKMETAQRVSDPCMGTIRTQFINPASSATTIYHSLWSQKYPRPPYKTILSPIILLPPPISFFHHITLWLLYTVKSPLGKYCDSYYSEVLYILY